MGCKINQLCRELFVKLGILPLHSQYIFSLLMFLFKNKHQFPVNTEIHHHATRQQSRTHKDKEDDDTDHQKQAIALARESVDNADDKYFTVQETRRVITSMDNKKWPGIDGITGEVYKSFFEIFAEYLTAMYNGCLNKGIFPKRWKTAKMIPIVKPGKENCDDASKFRPISLPNVGGKVLEKLLINRINHQI